MKKRIRKRGLDWQILILIPIFAAFAAIILYKNGYILGNRNEEIGLEVSLEGKISYSFGATVEAALDKLSDIAGVKPARVQSASETQQRKVSLVFCGMGTPAQMDQILKLLERYNVSAGFFVDGMSAAEDPETVQAIAGKGYTIGNYGFSAEKHWEDSEAEDVVISLAKTQSILQTLIDRAPTLCLANATQVNDELLSDAGCAGITTYVQPSSYLADTSFPTFSAAMGYVSKLDQGSIIAVKIGDVLDEIEYEPYEVDERPENDKQDSEHIHRGDEMAEKADIVVTVERLLEALDSTETAVVSLDRLSWAVDPAIDLLFREDSSAADLQVPASGKVGMDYFSDALFIGDSLTLALNYYTDLGSTADIQAYISVTPVEFVNNMVATLDDGSEQGILDAAIACNPRKIYILLGTNALSSGRSDTLLPYYNRLIQILQERLPNAAIYIQGMPPVTDAVSIDRITLSNRRIRKTNLSLAQLAEDTGCYYIDLPSLLADENGCLPTELAQEDGIHLNRDGCSLWLNYLTEHTVPQTTEN